MSKKIIIKDFCGQFAENKDKAKEIRENYLREWVNSDGIITIDFKDVDSSTQSFIHAMISSVFQEKGDTMLDKFEFINCNKAVKSLITTVINYSLE